MTDRPIIFSAPMMRALLSGRKLMTRRLLYSARKVKNGTLRISSAGLTFLQEYPPPPRHNINSYFSLSGWEKAKPGDRLWVRESIVRAGAVISYAADGALSTAWGVKRLWSPDWRRPSLPSIHMPRFASRITCIVSATKIERLQAISEADAIAEGMAEPYLGDGDPPFEEQATMVSAKMQFRNLWRTLHGPLSWEDNPWVVALSFSAVHKQNIDAIKETA